MSLKIYHNPRCSKSRQTLALLVERGETPDIIEYLQTPPTEVEIRELVKLLNVCSVRDIMRTGEAIYKELNLKSIEDEDKLIKTVVQNPKLLERPIVVKDGKAAVGRPPENVLALF